jgi:hypothetical protein
MVVHEFYVLVVVILITMTFHVENPDLLGISKEGMAVKG